jgi:hypothetical protein
MSKKLTRIVVTLLVLVTLTAGAAQAYPWSFEGPEPSRFAALWGWIASWFEPSEPVAVSTEGCGMDPNGNPGNC